MNFEVTRDVVSDLWPLCRSGDVSDDSRRLVESFLDQDDSFAKKLKENAMLSQAMPNVRLSPDAELRLLHETQRQARLKLMIVGGAIGMIGIITILAMAGAMWLVFHN